MNILKSQIKHLARRLGYKIQRDSARYSDPKTLEKAESCIERFREVVSDPLNLLINRVPEAGYVDSTGCVILHNGNRVPIKGSYAFYGDFSDILIINRGVHEPLEEYCFQTVLSKLRTRSPIMIELGAYWAHYSMWLKKLCPQATCYMVEADHHCLECGKHNFALNDYGGEFINATVGLTGLQLDDFVSEHGIGTLDILHSDIQGYELEMLLGGRKCLSENGADYIFISTHSQELHSSVVRQLREYSYRIEVSSDFDTHTTSCDGFVLATSPRIDPLFERLSPLGRVDIARSSPTQLIQSLTASHF